MPCWRIAILARVNQENLSAHTSKTAQGSQPSRAAANNDGIEIRGRGSISTRQGSSASNRSECCQHKSSKGTHCEMKPTAPAAKLPYVLCSGHRGEAEDPRNLSTALESVEHIPESH